MVERVTNASRELFLSKLLQSLILHTGVITASVIVIHRFDPVAGYSALLGGLIFLIPNGYLAIYAFRYNEELLGEGEKALHNLYKGEIGKFVLSAAGFAISFALLDTINVPMLFASYIILMLINWLVLIKLGI